MTVRTRAALAACLCGPAALTLAQPVDIPIANAGFEADAVASGCFQVLQPTGWLPFDPAGILNGGGNSVGGLDLPPGSVWFPAGAPEGEQAALVFLRDSIGAGPAGLRQELGATLAANTRYTLSVWVGDIASGTGPPPCDQFGFFDLDGFPGYQVQLLAGGVVVVQDDNGLAGALADGVFLESVTQVTIGAAHPQLGQPLEVRLINLNMQDTPEHPGIEVDFDDVRLTAEFLCGCPGDIDGDCDIDADDLAALAECLGGPDAPPAAGCASQGAADLDGDGDVDLHDYAQLFVIAPGACP